MGKQHGHTVKQTRQAGRLQDVGQAFVVQFTQPSKDFLQETNPGAEEKLLEINIFKKVNRKVADIVFLSSYLLK